MTSNSIGHELHNRLSLKSVWQGSPRSTTAGTAAQLEELIPELDEDAVPEIDDDGFLEAGDAVEILKFDDREVLNVDGDDGLGRRPVADTLQG